MAGFFEQRHGDSGKQGLVHALLLEHVRQKFVLGVAGDELPRLIASVLQQTADLHHAFFDKLTEQFVDIIGVPAGFRNFFGKLQRCERTVFPAIRCPSEFPRNWTA